MKKILMIALCMVIVPMLFAAESDAPTGKTQSPTNAAPIQLHKSTSPRRVPQSRDLLFSQIPLNTANSVACQLDSVYPFDADLVEDVTPTEDWVIDSVVGYCRPWGAWVGWSLVPNVRFLVYADSSIGNHPVDSPFVEIIIDQGTYETTVYGSGYIVGLPLPSSVNLTAGVTYWLEVQPCFSFTANGQIGTMTEVGIGNGQEFFNRFPLLGTPVFTTAAAGGWAGEEGGIELYGTTGAAVITWDFEDGWQDWTNTNGLTFPEAWGVETSALNGASWVCPDAGDSSMWIDSDAAGSGGFLLEDTVQSPLLIPNSGMDWLKYGLAYNWMSTGEYLEAGIKYFDGATWTVVPLKTYTADFGPAWDSVDVSAYAGYPNVQIYFFYTDSAGWYWYGAFDNVSIDAIIYVPEHDVGCSQVVSPPEGTVPAGDYDVIGRIQNYGNNIETFDVTANVYDTVGMIPVFSQTVTLTDFPVAGDSNVNFGTVTFDPDSYYYTEIFTLLAGDTDPSNDTSAIYSTTAMQLGDIIFELDIEAITGWSSHLGIEFDGTYFYVTSVTPTNVIHVIDTLGNLIWSIPQGTTTSWGMRDLAWDGVYAGADRIDTLYASDDNGTYQFGIDLTTGTMDVYPPFTGPPGVLPCRGLGWDNVDEWFFTANWDPLYKFTKDGTIIQGPVSGPGSVYGCAYDADILEGHYIWWHGQTGPYSCHLTQMNPSDMTMTGVTLDIPHTVSSGIAGGLCFFEGFWNMDVLFAIVQPSHIYGIYVRADTTGIEEKPGTETRVSFGFAPMTNPTKGSAISYITTTQGNVSLKVYDGTGRLVETLVNSVQPAGVNTVNWDTRNIANGVYFFKLESENQHATHKLILIK